MPLLDGNSIGNISVNKHKCNTVESENSFYYTHTQTSVFAECATPDTQKHSLSLSLWPVSHGHILIPRTTNLPGLPA